MRTVIIKRGRDGSLTLGNPAMPPGIINPKLRIAYYHITNVPDDKGPADVVARLTSTITTVDLQPGALAEDFVLDWEDLGQGKIVHPINGRADLADWVQAAVIRRAEKLGLTSYAIAKASGGAVSEDHVCDYLTRRKSMGSHKLQHVLKALGLRLVADDAQQ